MLRVSCQPGVTLAGTSPAPAFPAAAGGTASLRAKPAVFVVGVSRRRQREVESDAMWTRKKPFLASAGSGVVGSGRNQLSPPAKNNPVFNQIEVEWQNWNQMLAARRQVARRSPSLTVLCVCVFFSVGPGGADGEPQRGGLPGGRCHHPVSAHFQRHQPGAAPRHHTDVCGESDQASQQGGGEKYLSWVREILRPWFHKGSFFLFLKMFLFLKKGKKKKVR